MEIKFFEDSVEKFIQSLEKQTIAKVFRTLDLLEEFGPKLGMPHSRKIKHELFEIRIRGKQEVRLFYGFHRDVAIIVHGFVKKSQKIPQREVDLALHRLRTIDEA